MSPVSFRSLGRLGVPPSARYSQESKETDTNG